VLAGFVEGGEEHQQERIIVAGRRARRTSFSVYSIYFLPSYVGFNKPTANKCTLAKNIMRAVRIKEATIIYTKYNTQSHLAEKPLIILFRPHLPTNLEGMDNFSYLFCLEFSCIKKHLEQQHIQCTRTGQ